MHQIFSCLRDWVTALEDVPPGQANVLLNSTRADHENGNIPKSSILALSDCAYHVAVSEHVGSSLKTSLLGEVLELYFELRSSGQFDRYATALLSAVANAGKYRQGVRRYRQVLADVFDQEQNEYLIKNPEEYVAELEAALSFKD
jgi:hypothetical protein